VADLAGAAHVNIRIEVDPDRLRPADIPWLVGDPGLAERDTGWHVRLPLADTLRDVLEEWRRLGA
jgi:GDP-4-dehydro-6-deoxy-D-mannose reductase